MISEKILLVDDEPVNLQLLRHLLKKDYTLIFAKNAAEAFKNIEQHYPDLILLDVMMPETSGHELCEKIKKDNRFKKIPIIFVTAMGDEEDEKKGFRLGAVDYIVKPMRPSILKQRIRIHLDLNNQQQACEQHVIRQNNELRKTRLRGLMMLGKAAEYKDNETGLHVQRMARYSQIIARAYGWDEDACELMLNAAPMHDVGKIGTPDHILQKPGKLNKEEWIIMKQHPIVGAEIIGNYGEDSRLFKMAAVIAETHHEKWNGKGYPKGLEGEKIPIEGRIVAIADVFDALTSKRPYKEAWPVEKAVSLLKEESGSHFDSKLIKMFLENLDEALEIKKKFAEE